MSVFRETGSGQRSVVAGSVWFTTFIQVKSHNSIYSNATRNYATDLHFKVTKKMKTSSWMELEGWEQVRPPARRAEAGSRRGPQPGGQRLAVRGQTFVVAR